MTTIARPRAFLELALLICIVAFTPIGLGCPPVPSCDRQLAFTQSFHFENDCSSPLCGFAAIAGSASNVGTIHPGEHGMLIASGTTVRVPLVAPGLSRGAETLHLIARCDSGATLGATEEILVNGVMLTASASVPASDHFAAYDVTFFDSGGSMSTGTTLQPIALSLAVNGTSGAGCIVDDVCYDALAMACAFTRDSGIDARTDAARDATSDAFFTRPGCTMDAQCSAGERCLTTYPGGLCSRPCTTDAQCGARAICEPRAMRCLPSCTMGGLECDRFGSVCVATDVTGATRVCRPACFPAGSAGVPPGYPSCPGGLACDPYSGLCSPVGAMGSDDGDACTMDSDCRSGTCLTEVDSRSGAPTGWVGGYCTSNGRVPAIVSFVVGAPVPRGSCPLGTGVFPLEGETEGDSARCLKTCTGNSDCRPGYQCDHLLSAMGGGPFFSNGVCRPIDCNATGMTCPAGYGCVVARGDAAVTFGVCGPVGDAGVDAGGDASVDATVGD